MGNTVLEVSSVGRVRIYPKGARATACSKLPRPGMSEGLDKTTDSQYVRITVNGRKFYVHSLVNELFNGPQEKSEAFHDYMVELRCKVRSL